VSDSGSEMGAEASRQAPSDTACDGTRTPLTSLDSREQAARTSALPVRDEEAAGSNPATPTVSPGQRPPVIICGWPFSCG
jgi:hypothetical protein